MRPMGARIAGTPGRRLLGDAGEDASGGGNGGGGLLPPPTVRDPVGGAVDRANGVVGGALDDVVPGVGRGLR